MKIQELDNYISSEKNANFRTKCYIAGFFNCNKTKLNIEDIYDKYAFNVTISGEGVVIDEETQKEYHIRPGSIFQSFPYKKHSFQILSKSCWEDFVIIMPESVFYTLDDFYNFTMKDQYGQIDFTEDVMIDFKDYIKKLGKFNQGSHINIASETISLISKYLDMSHKHACDSKNYHNENIMKKAALELSSNLSKYLDLKQFSLQNGISYTEFRTKFKEFYGISPYQYRIKKRMQVASIQLLNSNRKVKDIAADLGYSSPFEFSNYFKKEYGISPLKYRKKDHLTNY